MFEGMFLLRHQFYDLVHSFAIVVSLYCVEVVVMMVVGV